MRDAEEEQIFRDAYFEELRLHADASVVEMATRVELELKARFAESVSSTWLCASRFVRDGVSLARWQLGCKASCAGSRNIDTRHGR